MSSSLSLSHSVKTASDPLLFVFAIALIHTLGLGQSSSAFAVAVEASSDPWNINLFHFPNPENSTETYNVTDPTSFKHGKLGKGKVFKIFIHGALSHCLKENVPLRIIQAYLRAKITGREDYNVLCLDYGPLTRLGATPPGKPLATLQEQYEYICEAVSEKLAVIILALMSEKYISSLDDVHIIGHSMGGQVSGLDIANVALVFPGEVNLPKQLDLSDAKFVDIIHTSTIGLKGTFGHVDFYPDGGLHQRSCLKGRAVSDLPELVLGGCSHSIVGRYWENSVDFNITACMDESWENYSKKRNQECKSGNSIIFGEYVPTSARGKYFLEYPLLQD